MGSAVYLILILQSSYLVVLEKYKLLIFALAPTA
jgi:hypothetical protein